MRIARLINRTLLRGAINKDLINTQQEPSGVYVKRYDYYTLSVLEVVKDDDKLIPCGCEFTLTFTPSDFDGTGINLDIKEEVVGYLNF